MTIAWVCRNCGYNALTGSAGFVHRMECPDSPNPLVEPVCLPELTGIQKETVFVMERAQ